MRLLHVVLLLHGASAFVLFELASFLPNVNFRPLVYYTNGPHVVTPTTDNIIRANGYPAETHVIRTDDGYLLQVHRIPPASKDKTKYPVILKHGNFQSSTDWVLNVPSNHSLGFLLAEEGYDVWMVNQRGNTYSNSHESFPLSSQRFWNFSFHEVGRYDVPAEIDYVLKVSGAEKVHYVSFSMGTSGYYVAMCLNESLSSKVALGVTLGPSVFQNHFINGAARFIGFTWKIGNLIETLFGNFPIMPHFVASLLHSVLPVFCNPKFDLLGVCHNFMTLAFGNDGGLITKDQLPLITSVAPTASGFKAWNHIVQLVASRRFAEYDYGRQRNLEVYGSASPPDYNFTKIRAPTAIVVGKNDFLAHRDDAKTIAERLPNLVELYTVPYEQFTHLDFSYGRHEALNVYRYVMNLISSFDPNNR